MTQPAVTITELDNALGVMPSSAGNLLAIVGTATAGALCTPATYGRVSDILADFVGGPLVEAAAYSLERYGRPVLVVRSADAGAGLPAALAALEACAVQWELVELADAVTPASFPAIEGAIAHMIGIGKFRAWIGNTRQRDETESAAQYRTALGNEFGELSSTWGMLCAGGCQLLSSVSGTMTAAAVSLPVAAREASVSQEVNTARTGLGPLPAVSVRDANGNPIAHDESLSPGLDDARFCVLRTWDGMPGVYVNRARLFAPSDSDFQLLTYRRVLNLARAALRIFFIQRLNAPVLVDERTGFILPSEAAEIEAGALAALRSVIMATPKASAVQFALNRNDNILATKTLTGQARVIPLGYAEWIAIDLGFLNPAMLVQTA